jgi:hypothetical protein
LYDTAAHAIIKLNYQLVDLLVLGAAVPEAGQHLGRRQVHDDGQLLPAGRRTAALKLARAQARPSSVGPAVRLELSLR